MSYQHVESGAKPPSQKQTAVLLKEFIVEEPHRAIDVSSSVVVPEPGQGEVRVRVTCRPIHPADIMSLQGYYPGISQDLPTVPGLEGAGYVDAVGPGGGGKFSKGARVVGTPFAVKNNMGGTWAQYVLVPEEQLYGIPKELDEESASQFYINPLTVRGMFDVLDIPRGEWLIQSAAGSVLGRQVIQMAKHFGVQTINVVRREEQKQELLEVGADEVIVSQGEGDSIQEQVQTITDGRGAYAGVDAVGGELAGKLLAAVRPQGTLLVYGAMAGWTFTASIPDVLFHLKVATGFNLNSWKEAIGREKFQKMLDEVAELMASGKVVPFAGKSFPLESAAEAVQEAVKSARGGKVLLKG